MYPLPLHELQTPDSPTAQPAAETWGDEKGRQKPSTGTLPALHWVQISVCPTTSHFSFAQVATRFPLGKQAAASAPAMQQNSNKNIVVRIELQRPIADVGGFLLTIFDNLKEIASVGDLC